MAGSSFPFSRAPLSLSYIRHTGWSARQRKCDRARFALKFFVIQITYRIQNPQTNL